MNSTALYDIIIVGGGPAGLTAAIYTSRAFLKTLVIAGDSPGGQLMLTTEVENFPGFPIGIDGPNLISEMRKQAERFNTDFLDKDVKKISGSVKDTFTVEIADGQSFKSKTIIIASGASAKWLNIESEQRLRGKGVSACATCDGFFFKNKVVAVVGAGDSAMEEANFLSKFASKVYILVRKSESEIRASKIMLDRSKKNSKIEFIYNTQVSEVLGDSKVEGLKLLNNTTNDYSELKVDGLFLAIGHTPNTSFLKDLIKLDDNGYIVVTNNTKTSVDGIFVAGDVADHRYRQAITASGMGCMAALDAEKYLASLD